MLFNAQVRLIQLLRAGGPWNVFYFIITIFFGAFYLINMMMAVVSLAYAEEDNKVDSASRQTKEEKKMQQVKLVAF